MKGRCFDMSAVAQLLKKPFKTPWSPPAPGRKRGQADTKVRKKKNQLSFVFSPQTQKTNRSKLIKQFTFTLRSASLPQGGATGPPPPPPTDLLCRCCHCGGCSSRLRPCDECVGHTLQCNSWGSRPAAFLSSTPNPSDELSSSEGRTLRTAMCFFCTASVALVSTGGKVSKISTSSVD